MPVHGKLIAIERDGTLNQLPEDFMRSPDDWVPVPGALEAVARLNQAGWRVVVYSSQAGLARGLFDMSTVNEVHSRMHKRMAEVGARVEAVFFCPHLPDEPCDCKQQDSGLLKQIAVRTGTPPPLMVVAGGTIPYLKLARHLGCETHLVLAGRASNDGQASLPEGIEVHADLMSLVDALLGQTAAGET
ncbi:MAG TPA: HAD-IIIA family hydrolase [Macromonas sp.]|nr:HAD-IIIA family hydrolase [Macromonas sp.]